LVTHILQYNATISEEYLKKFDDPRVFYDAEMVVTEKRMRIEDMGEIWKSIEEAGRG